MTRHLEGQHRSVSPHKRVPGLAVSAEIWMRVAPDYCQGSFEGLQSLRT
jgi:hypothetical protein